MTVDVLYIVVLCIFAGLAWYVNDKINGIPFLKTVVQVVIVVAAVTLLLQSLGLAGGPRVTVQ